MPARTLGPERVDWEVPHRLKKGTSVSQNDGPRRGGGLSDPTSAREKNETFFIRVYLLYKLNLLNLPHKLNILKTKSSKSQVYWLFAREFSIHATHASLQV